MVTYKSNIEQIERALQTALIDTTQQAQNFILDVTPRDPRRPPKDPSQRVTGNLKRSIQIFQVTPFHYAIGVAANEAEYWRYLEFGTAFIEARPFLRKGVFDNEDALIDNFVRVYQRNLPR